jgi:hypothetical protein
LTDGLGAAVVDTKPSQGSGGPRAFFAGMTSPPTRRAVRGSGAASAAATAVELSLQRLRLLLPDATTAQESKRSGVAQTLPSS